MTTELVKKDEPNVATVERTRGGATFTPRADIFESADELALYMDLPGVGREDLDIQFHNGELSIHGKVRERYEGEYLYREYGVGDFYRAFTVREDIDAEKINAELRHGVLTVHLPKSEAVKPKRIEVKSC